MPWKVSHVSEIRLALVQQVISCHTPVAQAARDFGVSRKTAYKWLQRYEQHPGAPERFMPTWPSERWPFPAFAPSPTS